MVAASARTQVPSAAPASLTVDVADRVGTVSPMLYGLMTEEINHSYEGGLYGELLQNRTFRSSWAGVENWFLLREGAARASLDLDKSTGPSSALTSSVKLTISTASRNNAAGLSNSGFWGIAVQPHTTYKGSFYARADNSSPGSLPRGW
jgi:alpha-N-arabinofuranosidase